MPATIVTLADAIAADLAAAAASFSQPITISRHDRLRFTPTDLAPATNYVRVVPITWSIDHTSRETAARPMTVDIGLQRKLHGQPGDGNADLDPLYMLLEEIEQSIRQQARPTAAPAARWRSSEVIALFFPEHLDELRIYTGVVRASYTWTT